MYCKTLELLVPHIPPYDETDTWFASFVGHHIVPIAPSLNRFWFTHYGSIKSQKWIKWRFECNDISSVQPHVDALIQQFQLFDQGYNDWDCDNDIGEGENSRFLGDNGRHQDKHARGNLAFDFLHAGALLFLHGLRGPDVHGRFQREPEKTSQFNVETSLEGYLHLFCNMTGVPMFAVECDHPAHGNHILSLIDFSGLHQDDPTWRFIRRARLTL